MVGDPDSEEAMESNNGTSLECLQTKNSHCDSLQSRDVTEENHEQKEEMNVQPGCAESNNSFHRVYSTVLNQGYARPFYYQEFWTRPNVYSDVQKVRQSQMNSFENHLYPPNRDYFLPIESRVQYWPLKMFTQGYWHDLQFQEFQYFVVIDFEATCDKEKKPHPQEIIEFPSVIVNTATGLIEASFQTYVRPAYHQLLTDFCKELTGIQQIQVDRGVPLNEALLMHDKWLEDKGIKHKNFAVVTWGDWDCRIMLESECRFKRIRKPPYFNRWINLKVPFQDVYGSVRNLQEAVQLSGLTWVGRPHCGLDDARNTARLLILLMHRGFRFSITNEIPLLMPPKHPTTYQTFKDHSTNPTSQHQNLKGATSPVPPFQPFMDPASKERCNYCFCGVVSIKCIIRKPGPMQGRCFFGCGNFTPARRAACNYFVWA